MTDNKIRIKNVLVFRENRKFVAGEIRMRKGRFAEVLKGKESGIIQDTEEEVLDGEGCYAIPGLVDIHFHGCAGADVCDADFSAIKCMAEYEASEGITSICPATMTLSEEELHEIMRTVGIYENRSGAKLQGIHMEGPFISPSKKGAQAAENIRACDVKLFWELQKIAKGRIKIVDVAPEEAGAIEFIGQVKNKVVVSVAHTTASYEIASEAFLKGATYVTHLYNAMPPFDHRSPGVVGAARDAKNCHVELICDGIHVHPSVVRATFAMFGRERIILISDSMRATGLPDGRYTLGGQEVFVRGVKAMLKDGTIAGSVMNLRKCMKTAVQNMGIPLEDAVVCATENPAKKIGIYDRCGSISVGKDADLVLLDRELNVRAVFINGVKQSFQPGGTEEFQRFFDKEKG